jgi:hypothetical protein
MVSVTWNNTQRYVVLAWTGANVPREDLFTNKLRGRDAARAFDKLNRRLDKEKGSGQRGGKRRK